MAQELTYGLTSTGIPIPLKVGSDGTLATSGGGGGGGGGNSIADIPYTDDSGTIFIYQDNGQSPPTFTAYNIPAGTVYTPTTNPRPYFPAALPLATNAAEETGGNLAAIASHTSSSATSDLTIATNTGTIATNTAQGSPGTGLSAPTGGSGPLGFLSYLSQIYTKLTGSIAVTGTFFQTTQPISGTVAVTATDGAITTLGAEADSAATTDTGTFTLMGFLKRMAQKLTSLAAQFPSSLGQKTSANSISAVVASDNTVAVSGTFFQGTQPVSEADGQNATLGAQADSAAGTDTGTSSLMSYIKRMAQRWTILFTLIPLALGASSPANAFLTTLPNDLTVSGAAATAVNTDLISGGVSGWFDAALFHSVSLVIAAVGTISAGVVSFEQTDDTTIAAAGFPLQMMQSGTQISTTAANTTYTLVTNTPQQYEGPIMARYFRVRISTGVTGGGTAQVTAVFSQFPYSTTRNVVVQGSPANFQMQGMLAANGTITSATLDFRSLSLVATGVNVKSSNGKAFTFTITNTNASIVWVKFYNKNTAPTVGTDTPVLTYGIQPNSTFNCIDSTLGVWFSAGIGIACTTVQSDGDSTAPTANTVTCNGVYG